MDNINIDFDINTESIHELEKEIKDFSKKEDDLRRRASEANKNVANLTLEFKITLALIISELRGKADEKGKPIPPSAIGELRKSVAPLDKRYQMASRKLHKANEEADILNGTVSSWVSRGYRLQELVKLALQFEPKVYDDKFVSIDSRLDGSENNLKY